jgi:hypothetical protein
MEVMTLLALEAPALLLTEADDDVRTSFAAVQEADHCSDRSVGA